MMFLLILILLRESAGDTFFHYYEQETPTLTCNKATDSDAVVWYGGCSSLLTFNLMNCDGKDKTLQPCEKKKPGSLCKERNVSIAAFPYGGIFACKPLIDDETAYKCPVFNNQDDCNTYDIFIIARINSPTDQAMSEDTSKALELVSVNEKDNFTLSCEFSRKRHHVFAMYWIKDTDPSTCIFSVTNEDNDYLCDKNCCIDATVKLRRGHDSTDPQEPEQRHAITIHNATPSDSGRYLCVFSQWSKAQHMWKIVSNVSVEVKGAMRTEPSEALKIGLLVSGGVIAGLVLIGGMACFLFQKKKSRGRPSELHHERTHSTAELPEVECSPYAVSSHNDTGRIEGVYSLAGSPGIQLTGASSLLYDKTASEVQPGGNVQAIYAKVNKQT